MTAFLWTMVALFTFNCVCNAYYLGSGRLPAATTSGVRGVCAVVLLIEGALLIWGLSTLEVL